jgi:heat shock protein HtpX
MFKNYIKTALLLGLLSGLMIFIGALFGGTFGLIIGITIAIGINFVSYWFSDKIVLKMYRAKEVDKNQMPKIYEMVKEVSHRAKIPMPKVYVVENSTPNAFATGRNPKNGVIAFTTGILNLLNEEELKGVIAHEISHIKNRDILVASIAATIAAVISFVASMAQWAAIFGGFGSDDGPSIIELLALAIIAPIAAVILQMGISRSREFLADESASKILKNSHGLSSALLKLEKGIKHNPFQNESHAGASLFILNPFKAKGLINLFSTHPSVEARVERLKRLKY